MGLTQAMTMIICGDSPMRTFRTVPLSVCGQVSKTARRFSGTVQRLLLDLEIMAASIVLNSNGSHERKGFILALLAGMV